MRFLSLENLDQNETDLVEASELEKPYAELAENSLLEASDSAREAEDVGNEIEKFTEASDGLTAQAERIEETLPEGGLTEGGLGIARAAAEGYYRMIGQSARSSKVLASESFGKSISPEARLQSTKACAENLRQDAGKIAKAAIAGIRKFLERVRSFFKQILDSRTRLISRAKVQASKAAKTDGTQADKVKALPILSIDGKPVEGNAVVNQYQKLKTLELFGEKAIREAKKLVEEASGKISSGEIDEAWQIAAGKRMSEIIHGKDESSEGNNGTETVNDLPFGGAKLIVQHPKQGGTPLEQYFGLSKARAYLKPADRPSEVTEVSPMSKEQCIAACRVVGNHLTDLARVERESEELNKAITSALDALEKTAAEDEEKKKVEEQVKTILKFASQCASAGVMQRVRYDVMVSKAVLDFVDISLAAYTKA